MPKSSGMVNAVIFHIFVSIVFGVFTNFAFAASLNCENKSGLESFLQMGCKIQLKTKMCENVVKKFNQLGVDLVGHGCDPIDESQLSMHATVLCSGFVMGQGLSLLGRYRPEYFEAAKLSAEKALRLSGQAAELALGKKIALTSGSILKSTLRFGTRAIPAVNAYMTCEMAFDAAAWFGEKFAESSQRCFDDIEEKRARINLAKSAANALAGATSAFISASDHRKIQFAEEYTEERFLKNISCEELQRLIDGKRKAADQIVGSLLAKKILSSDPRQEELLSQEDERQALLLSEALPCLSADKGPELLCAIGNLITSGKSLTKSLSKSTHPRILGNEEFRIKSRQNFLENAEDDLAYGRRSSGTKSRVHPEKSRSSARAATVEKYRDKVITSEAQNLEFMELANHKEGDGKTLFFHRDNFRLKALNDTTNDQDLITALTHKEMEMEMRAMDALAAANPGLKITRYSDFKSTAFAFSGRKPENLQDQIDSIYQNLNKQYTREIQELNVIRNYENGYDWFRGGLGETADQASLRARMARNFPSDSRLGQFSDLENQNNLQRTLSQAEADRQRIVKEFRAAASDEKLYRIINQQNEIPTREVFELTRKYPEPKDFQVAFERQFGIPIPSETAQNMVQYSAAVDQFSPPIFKAKREILSLEDAVYGGIKADIKGAGGYNLEATALGLKGATGLEDATVKTRVQVDKVSGELNETKESMKREIQNYLTDKKNIKDIEIKCTGDECGFIFSRPVTLAQQEELFQRLSRTESPNGIRYSVINNGILDSADRNIMASQGETIEKMFRAEIAGKIAYEKQGQFLTAVHLQGDQIGKGDVRISVGNSKVPLEADERKEIRAAYERAIDKFNRAWKNKYGEDSSYRVVFGDRF